MRRLVIGLVVAGLLVLSTASTAFAAHDNIPCKYETAKAIQIVVDRTHDNIASVCEEKPR